MFLLFLVLFIFLTFSSTDQSKHSLSGNGTITNPYLIENAEDLLLFCEQVNTGRNFQGEFLKQTADIDLSSVRDWTPIGIYGSDNYFLGIYNGNGYSINNLTSNTHSHPGLFGQLGGTVMNLELTNCNISGKHSGGITSHSTGSPQIINCIVSGEITGSYRAGGIADNFSGGIISNCYSDCTIYSDCKGAIIAYNATNLYNCISADELLYTDNFSGTAQNCLSSVNYEDCKNLFNKYINESGTELKFLSTPGYNLWEIEKGTLKLGTQVNFPKVYIAYFTFILLCIAIPVSMLIYYYFRDKKLTPRTCFCLISMSGIIATICALICTHGEIWSQIFFRDKLDTGMDFFHSIEYTKGRSPYKLFNTLYPPLANLLFYFLYRMIPSWQYNQWANNFYDSISMRGTSSDLRVYQPTLILYFAFIIIVSFLFISCCQKLINSEKQDNLSIFCALFSYGMLYAFERGNIIIISLIGVLFYLIHRNSNHRLLKELALIALAISAGLKVYPAVFGLLLLYDKKYKDAIKAALYGIIVFVLPVFAFKEKISGIGMFLKILFSWSKSDITEKLIIDDFNFSTCLNHIVVYFSDFFRIEIDVASISALTSKIGMFLCILLVFSGFFLKKQWQKTLLCTLILIGYQSQGRYILMFLLLPLLLFLREEKKLTRQNIIPFLAMCLSITILPIGTSNEWFYLRFQLSMLILLCYVIFVVLRNFKSTQFFQVHCISIFDIKLKYTQAPSYELQLFKSRTK